MRLLLIFFFLFAFNCLAQNPKIEVKGDIVDGDGVGITNCTVKIAGQKSGIIYSYFNTGIQNHFTISIHPIDTDSITVTISHAAYETLTIAKAFPKNQNIIRLNLKMAVKTLKQVDIKAPAIWVRGDTTFYKVDAFKEGDEKKLKDLLVKLPHFEVTGDGDLLYKKLPVEKVTVDGEELFSDKIDLMINNFPIHVLNTIDAIENQSEQKLLKGLTNEKKVFLNLGLKKDTKLKTAFGDGEIGGGTQSRYSVTPVVFSLYGKIKAGFIANWNSIGNGISWGQENELKKDEERRTANLLMYNNPLHLINNFENRWYIKNRQWDNRLQINTTFQNKTKSQTEIAYLVDKQTQSTSYNQSLYNGYAYESRIDSNYNIYRPKILSIKQTFTSNLDSLTELKTEISTFFDFSTSSQQSSYSGFNIQDQFKRDITNRWSSYALNTSYIKRQSVNKATSLFLKINAQNLGQDGEGVSGDFANIFNTGNSNYNTLTHHLASKVQQFNVGWYQMNKSNHKQITNFGISFDYLRLAHRTISQLNAPLENITPISILPVDSLRNYYLKQLNAHFTKSLNILFKKPWNINVGAGLAHVSSSGQKEHSSVTYPVINVKLNHDHNLLNTFTGVFNGSFIQMATRPDRIFEYYSPIAVTTFRKSTNIGTAVRKTHLYYGIAYDWGNMTNSFLYVSFDHNFNNNVFLNRFNGIVQYYTDSVVNHATNAFRISMNHTIPSLLVNALFDIDASYAYSQSLVQHQGEIKVLPYSNYVIGLSVKKNWDRKYFIKVFSRFNANAFKFPSNIANNIPDRVLSLQHMLYQRLVLGKQMNLMSTISYYQNNLSSPDRAQFLFADIEATYQVKSMPLFFSAKIDNLTNQKNFYNFRSGIQVQSFNTIPLVSRNFYLSLKYSF
ncbi:hypothetical protein [Pedobacter nanyangensis]|uniref:hypothetical protein n=1 Tax=Pedobacter nanyangensis TaxID=1562389 RepID=UPI0013B36D49|nr:hypothetical protein [Pedobacter nanyangensis]